MHDSHCQHETPPRPGRKLKYSVAGLILLTGVSYLPGLAPLNAALYEYLGLIWWAVLLGLLVGGLIDHFIPDALISNLLGRRSGASLIYAVSAGFLMAACSHGILAIAIQLHKKGASIPATVTFLLASPWANFPVTILMFGFFGWQALWLIGGAMLIAITSGFLFMLLEKLGLIETSPSYRGDEAFEWEAIRNFSWRASAQGVYSGAMSLANMVLWWIILGFTIAVFIKAYVPHEWFMDYFGPGFWGLLATLLVATVIEICSEGSSPIAFEIYSKVGTLGNPFVFLMAGVVTDYTEIGLLWTNIGKRTAIWLPLVTVPQVLLLGMLFNQL